MVGFVQSLCRFLRRVLSDLPGAIGSNELGLWFPFLPAVLLSCYQIYKDGWQTMMHGVLTYIVITSISYALLFLYCVTRNLYREHRVLVSRNTELDAELENARNISPWAGYESEKAWRDNIGYQNRLIDLGRLVEGVLSSLQMQALHLAKDIDDFSQTFPARPVVDGSKFDNRTAEGMQDYLAEQHRLVDPWEDKLGHSYVAHFSHRLGDILHGLGAEGYDVAELEQYSKWVASLESLRLVPKLLRALAVEAPSVEAEYHKVPEA